MRPAAPHGATAWRKKRCRCDECREAAAAAIRRAQQSRIIRLKADPSLAQHGERSTYTNWGCRCSQCTAAQAEYWSIYSQGV